MKRHLPNYENMIQKKRRISINYKRKREPVYNNPAKKVRYDPLTLEELKEFSVREYDPIEYYKGNIGPFA